jgi:hypothetical protein
VTGVLEDPLSPHSLTVRIWGLNCLWARARTRRDSTDKIKVCCSSRPVQAPPSYARTQKISSLQSPQTPQIGAHLFTSPTHPPAFAEALLGSQVVCCSLLELGLNITWSQWTSTHQRPIHRMPIIMQLWMNLNLVNIWFLPCSQFFKKIGLTYR